MARVSWAAPRPVGRPWLRCWLPQAPLLSHLWAPLPGAGHWAPRLHSSCFPVQDPSSHSLHLTFSDFARTRFKDVRNTVLTAEETFYFFQDATNCHVEEAQP